MHHNINDKKDLDDIIIVGRGKALNGDECISYFIKGELDLKRIALKEDFKDEH